MFPYLTGVNFREALDGEYYIIESVLIKNHDFVKSSLITESKNLFILQIDQNGILVKGPSNKPIRLHDKCSSHYILIKEGKLIVNNKYTSLLTSIKNIGTNLRQILDNIEEWKVKGYYCISVLG